MPISFDRPNSRFWANASSDELYMLNLQELFDHIFYAHYSTTIDFLSWLPSAYEVSEELCKEAANKKLMLQTPISYSNEDIDRKANIASWAIDRVPAKFWRDFRNTIAYERHTLERDAAAEKAS